VQVAPSLHRLGNGLINSYLVEESGQVTIIDAGVPGYWGDIPAELAAMGRSIELLMPAVQPAQEPSPVVLSPRIRIFAT